MKNPFNPTFGDVPSLFLQNSIDDELHEIIKMIEESDYARSIFITGVRGVGKTALMMSASEYFAKKNEFYIVDLINKDGMLASLVRLLSVQANSQIKSLLKNINSISLSSPVGGISLNKDVNSNLDILLDEIMKNVQREGKKVLITIDEVDNSKAIKDFIQVFSSLKRKKYPVYLLMTGLPDLVLNLQNDKKLTFLLRSDKVIIRPRQKLDVYNSYLEVFKCQQSVALKLARMTQGYSYAFQLLGYLLFNQVHGNIPTDEDIDKISQNYKDYLYNNAYQKIFSEMSQTDREYLLAIRGGKKLEETAKLMGKNNVFVAQYRRRAIERNLIAPEKLGYVKFTLPYFEDYLNETQDVDSLFYLGI